jgi:hypothetical protein
MFPRFKILLGYKTLNSKKKKEVLFNLTKHLQYLSWKIELHQLQREHTNRFGHNFKPESKTINILCNKERQNSQHEFLIIESC